MKSVEELCQEQVNIFKVNNPKATKNEIAIFIEGMKAFQRIGAEILNS